MESMYAESSVKKIREYKDFLYKMLIAIALLYTCLALFKFVGPLVGFMGIGFSIFFLPIIFGRFNVEYEYILCDDQLDFDIIRGGTKRKHYLRVTLENAEYLAPNDNEKIKEFKIDTVCELYSKRNDVEPYALIVKKNDKMLKILFEPGAKVLKCMKYKLPRKYVLKDEDVNATEEI